MAHRATASSGQKETETAAFASLTAADIIRAPIVQRRIPVDFRPLLKPFKSAGRLCLRIERLPQGAKLSAGRRSTDNSWSLASDELEDLEYLVSSNVSPDHELTVRVMTFEDGAASTLKVVQFAMPAPPGDADPVQTGRDPHAQDTVTRSQLSEMHSLFAVRESELVELRAALQRAVSEKESELEKARGEWELEVDRKIAEALAQSGLHEKLNGEAKEADRKGRAAREQQQAEQRVAAEREKAKKEFEHRLQIERQNLQADAERRIEAARQQWQADAGPNLDVARQVWQKDAEERQRAEIKALVAEAERRIQAQADEKAARERKLWSTDANQQIEEARLAWEAEDDERRREDFEKWNADVDQRIEDERRKWLAEGSKHDRAEFERSKAEIESRIRSERQSWQVEADEQTRKDRDSWQADTEQRIEAVRRTCQADADTKLATEFARWQAEAEKLIEAVRRTCQADADTKFAAELARLQAETEKRVETERQRFESEMRAAANRIETERQRFESEMRAAAKSAAEASTQNQEPEIDREAVQELAQVKEKNTQLNAALAAESDRCREAETALAAMTLRCENAERSQKTGEGPAPAGESDDGYIRGLRAEISTLRKSMANQAAELARARASLEQSRPMHIQRGPENRPLGNLRDVLQDDEEDLGQERKKGLIRDCLMVAAVVIPLILCYPWIAAYLPQPVRSGIGVATAGVLSVEEEKPVVPHAPPKKAAPAPQVSRPTATASRVLNVHATPGSKGEVLFSLPKNTVVALLETQGNWTRIEAPADDAAKAKQGWVYSAYLHDNDN
jgi:hypothetical protein